MKIAILTLLFTATLANAAPPNVLVVLTDDQGWAELGCQGNPVIRTPNIDAFAKQSVCLKNFYVSPVCSPTRSSLLTGLYNYRTGIVDTAFGRSMMRPDVTTLPQILAAKGYRTGLFGKWHLGDNYPLRPEDRGFQSTLWHRGGGLSQPADPPGTDPAKAYFDPVLIKNGQDFPTKGYCTDIFTDAAIDFINAKDEKPFFARVAFNAPHSPFQVPEQFAAPYRKMDLTAKGFPNIGNPWAGPKLDTNEIANAYGMIENIDTNFAKLMKALDDKKIAENTIVLFLSDNGVGGMRFNGGLRNRKTSVYEGGIRVPCYLRYPAKVKPFEFNHFPTMHIDITPTIDSLTGGSGERKYDGRDLSKRLLDPNAKFEEAPRTLFLQWHRGDVPEKGRAFMARNEQYKLVQAAGVQENAKWKPKYELFEIVTDQFEQHDLAEKIPEMVKKLNGEYEGWFADVTKKGFEPPRIIVGNAKENPLRLSRQDWKGEWKPDSVGTWHVRVEKAGTYQFTLISKQKFTGHSLFVGEKGSGGGGPDEVSQVSMKLEVPAGDYELKPTLKLGEKSFGPDYLTVELLK